MQRRIASLLCVWIGWSLGVVMLFMPVLRDPESRPMFTTAIRGYQIFNLGIYLLYNGVLYGSLFMVSFCFLFASPLLCSYSLHPNSRVTHSIWAWAFLGGCIPFASVVLLLWRFDAVFPGFYIFSAAIVLSMTGLTINDPGVRFKRL